MSEVNKMKKFLIILSGLIIGSTCLFGEPFPKNKDSEKVYDNLEYIAVTSGENELWKKTISETPTRLDLAVFLNHCLILCEEKNIEISDSILLPLLSEFDRELLILDLQNRLQKQNDYFRKIKGFVNWNAKFSFACEQIAGDLPLTERELTLYGSPPPNSVISFSQQFRLKLSAGTEKTYGWVTLKNFGFWGIGKYSSGASGINFSSSDPPAVKEIAFEMTGRNILLSIGRKYLRLGKYGLSVDYLYSPLEAIQLSGGWKHLTTDFLIGSRFDSADYYAARLGTGTEKLNFGLLGFVSDIKQDYRTLYNLTNDNGLGCDFNYNFLGKRNVSAEYSFYKPSKTKTKEMHSYVGSVDFVKSRNYQLTVKYGDLGEIPRQTISLSQLPLEFTDEKFLRFSENSRGPNLLFVFPLLYNILANYEFLYLEMRHEPNISRKHILRFNKNIFTDSNFILEDAYTIDNSFKYNTARIQITFSF